MKRKLIALFSAALILVSILAVPAGAVNETSENTATISPRYVNISVFAASIDINSSGKASCYSDVETANSTYKISLYITLQRYVDGYWKEVKTWNTSGTGDVTLDKSYYVTPGYYYRTAATATVRTSGGSYVESATIYSQSDYY